MDENTQLESLIAEELSPEDQAIIAGGNGVEFFQELYSYLSFFGGQKAAQTYASSIYFLNQGGGGD